MQFTRVNLLLYFLFIHCELGQNTGIQLAKFSTNSAVVPEYMIFSVNFLAR